MVFGNISTLCFPTAANAGSSQWGTDVRKLLDAADAGTDTTTVTNHGTGGAVTRTCDPYSTNAADSDQTLFGWAVSPTDMGSTADFVRSYAAGNHILTARVNSNSAVAANATMTVFVYRVGPSPTRTRTLLGSATSAAVSMTATPATITATVALGAITFASDETIQYSVELNCSGLAVTGRTLTFRTGTDGGVAVRVDTPILKTLAATAGTVTDVGTATGSLSAVGAMQGAAAGLSIADGDPTAVTGTAGTATGAGTAQATATGIAGYVGQAEGSAVADGELCGIASMAGTAQGVSTLDGDLSAFAGMTGQAEGTSVVLGVPASLSGTVGFAEGLSSTDGILGAILATTGTAGTDCPECPGGDWSPNNGTKAVSGTVFDHETGDPVGAGVPVWLIRDSDGFMIGPVATDAGSVFSFPRDTNDPYTYHTYVTYMSGAEQIHGVSDAGITPS